MFRKVVYRPFDERHTYFTGTSKGFIGTPGTKVNSLLLKENVALLFKRQCKQTFSYVFLVDKPVNRALLKVLLQIIYLSHYMFTQMKKTKNYLMLIARENQT